MVRIRVPQTPEILLIQARTARRFRHRYLGWTGLILGFTFPLLTGVSIARREWLMAAMIGAVATALLLWMAIRYCYAGRLAPLSLRMPLDLLWQIVDDITFGRLLNPRVGDDATHVELDFSVAGVTVVVNEGEPCAFAWSDIPELWQFPDCWMLILGDPDRYMPLPAYLLDAPCQELIVHQIQTAGGTIQPNPGLGLGLVWRKEYLANRRNQRRADVEKRSNDE